MSSLPTLSIVIPLYNEEDNVAPLLREIQQELSEIPYEILAVDDGSSDHTLERLKSLLSQIPQLRILQHLQNTGQSASLLSGVKAATGTWVASLDGDGQNPPSGILTLWKVMQQNPNPLALYAGNRSSREDNTGKRWSSRLANMIRRFFLKDDCPDSGCGLKLFAREAFLALPHFNHLHRFLPALYYRAGGEVINVAVSHRPRLRGTSKYGFYNRAWVGLVDLLGVWWLLKRPCSPTVREMKHE